MFAVGEQAWPMLRGHPSVMVKLKKQHVVLCGRERVPKVREGGAVLAAKSKIGERGHSSESALFWRGFERLSWSSVRPPRPPREAWSRERGRKEEKRNSSSRGKSTSTSKRWFQQAKARD